LEFGLLFRVARAPNILTRADLMAAAYPQPGGQLYFGYGVHEIGPAPISVKATLDLAKPNRPGAPVALAWATLFGVEA
jgi:hypothetical protein